MLCARLWFLAWKVETQFLSEAAYQQRDPGNHRQCGKCREGGCQALKSTKVLPKGA